MIIIAGHIDALVARAGVAEVGARHGPGTAPASRRRVSQPADKHVAPPPRLAVTFRMEADYKYFLNVL